MNPVRTKEEWARLAAMSKEKNVPEGYVYVGLGMRVDLGFGRNLITNFDGRGGWDCEPDKNTGKFPDWHYACPVQLWEERTGLKFMNEILSIKETADEVGKAQNKLDTAKAEVEKLAVEARKLIGRTVDYDGKWGDSVYEKYKGLHFVREVEVYYSSKGLSPVSNSFFKKHGYVIVLFGTGNVPFHPSFIKTPPIQVNGYTGENKGDYWKFGCAEIDTKLLKAAKILLESSRIGNRDVKFVKIGDGEFTLDILKQMFPDE